MMEEFWQAFLALAVGAVGVGMLAMSNTKVAVTPANGDTALLNRAVQAALKQETDTSILTDFSNKLRAAGFTSYADAIDSKRTVLARGLASTARTNITMVPQVQSVDGRSYQVTKVTP
jgi:hypothetical protein